MFTKLNIRVYFILPVLSRLSPNSSMKTGKRTPKAKANPIVRTIHNVEQKQRNHDQMLSCLTDETSPQHEAIFREDLESIPRKWHLYSVLNIDLESTSFHEYKVSSCLYIRTDGLEMNTTNIRSRNTRSQSVTCTF